MPRWLTLPATLALIGALALGIMVALRDRPGGIARLWTIFGPADQGPADFATLTRRRSPNDALVCPSWLCRAVPDMVASVYALDADTLRSEVRRAILAGGDAEQVATQGERAGDRFVVRTPVLRFPDTVDVLVLPQAGGRATLAIYSRSLLGRGDLGTNLARIRRWLADPALRKAVRGTAAEPVD